MIDPLAFSKAYTASLGDLLRELPFDGLAATIRALERAYREQKHVFLVGNGGSAATAAHMACDLMWTVARTGKPGLRAHALSDHTPTMTAIANDRSYDEVFSAQLETLANPGDLLIAISGSGNSPNIVRAVEVARAKRLTTVAFLGMDGGKVAPLADVPLIVPSNDYGPIEDMHMMFDHLCTAYLKKWIDDGCPRTEPASVEPTR